MPNWRTSGIAYHNNGWVAYSPASGKAYHENRKMAYSPLTGRIQYASGKSAYNKSTGTYLTESGAPVASGTKSIELGPGITLELQPKQAVMVYGKKVN